MPNRVSPKEPMAAPADMATDATALDDAGTAPEIVTDTRPGFSSGAKAGSSPPAGQEKGNAELPLPEPGTPPEPIPMPRREPDATATPGSADLSGDPGGWDGAVLSRKAGQGNPRPATASPDGPVEAGGQPWAHGSGLEPQSPEAGPTFPDRLHADRLAEQVARTAEHMARRGGPERYTVGTTLEPKNLGPVAVEIELTAGSLRAHFTVANADALQALGAQQSHLRNLMAEMGLALTEFQVALGGGGGEGRRRGQEDPEPREPPFDALLSPVARSVAGVGRSAGTINYLA